MDYSVHLLTLVHISSVQWSPVESGQSAGVQPDYVGERKVLLTADEWGKAAKRAKRLSTVYGLRRESNIAYKRAKKSKIRHRVKANVYSEDAITFSQTTTRNVTKKERNRAKNTLSATESCQTSFDNAQKSIRKSDEHLKRLGINFEAEEAARKKAKEARKKDEEARRGEAAAGLLSLHRT